MQACNFLPTFGSGSRRCYVDTLVGMKKDIQCLAMQCRLNAFSATGQVIKSGNRFRGSIRICHPWQGLPFILRTPYPSTTIW